MIFGLESKNMISQRKNEKGNNERRKENSM
jgi:hypothetical protein